MNLYRFHLLLGRAVDRYELGREPYTLEQMVESAQLADEVRNGVVRATTAADALVVLRVKFARPLRMCTTGERSEPLVLKLEPVEELLPYDKLI